MSPVPFPAPAAAANGSRVSPGTANSVYQVKPIPVPDVKTEVGKPSGRPVAPPLLNTSDRNRTALQTGSVKSVVTPAVWTTPATATPESRNPEARPAPSMWNDSGWRSVRDW